MLGFVFSTAILFLTCISGILGSGITTFIDDQCKTSHEPLEVKNGYPDGVCTALKIKNGLEAFQIVQLDPGCAVTLYGPNDDSGQACSSPVKIVGELAACYNSSWIYYSVDNCFKPNSVSSSALVLPTVAASPSSTLSSSSSTSSPSPTSSASSSKSTTTPPPTKNTDTSHTPAIIGAIIGSVAICAALIALLVFCLHQRKSQPGKPLPHPPSYELSQERALSEMARSSIVPPTRTVQKEMWASEAAVEMGRNSYAPPVELPAASWGEDKKRGSALIHVHLAR
ncbi:hypothetical protein DPSP01_004135 [Paraphaeosphaeria sporulosa]|uniref:Mid2 domain-containing protein n=1 Tax=Paraphaeosphaeria sporulosa TaxID=1460663 RepID=A0A177CCX9_9PLEO|nr:uncharacterized protein CC84DRAFT_1218089 [Paraphaeosphaeria sporulosa]OAG04659.1 hypothetical protein CC84DRAFT_1218089 [Paraphaeosphaeria sporulosa]